MAFILFCLNADQETEEILEPGDTQPKPSLQKSKRRTILTSLYYLIQKEGTIAVFIYKTNSLKFENRTEHSESRLTETGERENCKCNGIIISEIGNTNVRNNI